MVASLKRLGILLCGLSLPYLYWLWNSVPDPTIAARASACWLAALALPSHSHMASRISRTVLILLAVPWETYFSVGGDHVLAHTTASAATWCIEHLTTMHATLTTYHGMPTITTEQVGIAVSNQCAGLLSFLAFIGLGTVLAELFLSASPSTQWRFLILCPFLGWCANVARIAASTAVAYTLYQRGYNDRWELWHDVIGYVTFIMVYASLFAIARWRVHQTTTPRPTPPATA